MQFSLDEMEPSASPGKTHARLGTPAYRRVESDPFLLPSCIEEEIPKDHLVRNLWKAVQSLDLSPMLNLYDHKGGLPYPPERLLAVVLFGMKEGVRSSRALQDHCRYDLRYRYLMGDLKPDDRTFSRFLQRIDPVCQDLFRSVSRLLQSRGLGKVREVGVDGIKTPCSASWWKYTKNSDVAPSDPEARILESHGRYLVGYNAQFAVNLEDGSIVGVDVLSEQNDFHAIPEMLPVIHRQSGELPTAVFADAGYDSCDNIQTLEDSGIDSVIAPAKPLPEEVVENEEGELVCPSGRRLVCSGQSVTKKSGILDVYRPEGGCRNCPLKANCGFFTKSIRVPQGADPAARFRNQARLRSPIYHRATVKRSRVERTFGIRNRCDQFGRILRKGKTKALTELLLWAMSYNIRLWSKAEEALFSLVLAFLDLFRTATSNTRSIYQSTCAR